MAGLIAEEAEDALLYMNGRPTGVASPPASYTGFLTNNDKSNTSKYPNGFPVIQALPTGLLDPDPDLVNPGGYSRAHFRFQSRLPTSTPGESMSFASFQSVIENPLAVYTQLGPIVSGSPDPNGGLTITSVVQTTTTQTISIRFRVPTGPTTNVVVTPTPTGTYPSGPYTISVRPSTNSGQLHASVVRDLINNDVNAKQLVFATLTGDGSADIVTDDTYHLLQGPTDKHTYNGLTVTLNGYQGGYSTVDTTPSTSWDAPQSTTALNVTANTAGGQANGKAEGIVVSAQSDYTPASATLGTGATNTRVLVTAKANNRTAVAITVAITVTTTTSVTVNSSTSGGVTTYAIEVKVPNSTTTSGAVATLINSALTAPNNAAYYVNAVAQGDGSGYVSTVAATTLTGGMLTNGKQVAVQARVLPYVDPTANLDNIFDCYAYAANSNGNFPGYGAFIAKSKDDSTDGTQTQGWYNAYMGDMQSIVSRFIWLEDVSPTNHRGFIVTASNSTLRDPPTTPYTYTKRNGIWLGIGTECPLAPVHLLADTTTSSGNGAVLPAGDVHADLRLELTNSLANNDVVGKLAFAGHGSSSSVKDMGSITAKVPDATANAESAVLEFRVARGGTPTNTMTLGRDLAITGKLNIGSGSTVTAANSMSVSGAAMLINIDNSGGAQLVSTFSGGNIGDIIVVRTTTTGNNITFDTAGNIRNASTVILSKNTQTCTFLLLSTNFWVPMALAL